MWQQRIFLCAGLFAALLLASTALRSVVGLSTSEKPTPPGVFEIPKFAALIRCNAHFSHEILRIKSGKPSFNGEADLPTMHRNYRRLHRLMRQVGRRDGVPPAVQTARLKQEVVALNELPGLDGAGVRDARCRSMANMPVARKRHSQRIVGQ